MTSPTSRTNVPGGILFAEGDITLNAGRDSVALEVTNTGDRAVQVGSHFHFFEVNGALRFARAAAYGRRLDIPSGTSVRFEAGQTHEVALVPFGGRQRIAGFQGLAGSDGVDGAMARARERGLFAPQDDDATEGRPA